MSARIAVLGGGSWGTALAQTLCRGDSDVVLWTRDENVAAAISRDHRNPRYLSDEQLQPSLRATSDLAAIVRDAEIIIIAVPSQAMRGVGSAVAQMMPHGAVVVSAAKGFELHTGLTMTAVLQEVLPPSARRRVTALSGPNIAVEVVRGLPAASVVAGLPEAASVVRDACTHTAFRVYSTSDCVGVEYAGALKNVVAIAAGACDGLGAGDNGKAAIMTRGLAEMARLGVAAGANVMTFAGLAGIGDCMVTCTSPHSRNRRLGEALARGATVAGALGEIRMVAEGIHATQVAMQRAATLRVDMPITREVHAVLFESKPVAAALVDLMRRDPAEELRGLDLREAAHGGSTREVDSPGDPGSSSGG